MENVDINNLKIGEPKQKYKSGNFEVLKIDIREIVKEQKKIGRKIILTVLHPERELELSKVRFQDGDKIKEGGIWLLINEDKQIEGRSALAKLLNFYQCEKLGDLIGKNIETTIDDNGYLIVRAY